MAAPRLFIGAMGAETNSFTPFPTGYADFEASLLCPDGVGHLPPGLRTVVSQMWERLGQEQGWAVTQGLHANAPPAGPVVRAAYERLRDQLLDGLRAAGGADIVLLKLHGAMVAEGCDDCEGDILARVRQLVGPAARIGVLLDLHCHLTDAMLEAADIVVLYKAYPHTDYKERGREVFELVRDAYAGRTKPVMAKVDCPVLGLFPTTRAPFSGLVEDMQAAEQPPVLSLSLSHGFPWADLPITGGAALAVVDGDAARAEREATSLAQRFMVMRQQATMQFVGMDEAIARLTGHKSGKPLLLADTADQIGGGGPGDSTYLLAALIEAGIGDVCFAPLWDASAVHHCFQAGEDAQFVLRIGGKYCPLSGDPLDLPVRVKALFRDAHQDWVDGETIRIGDLALVETCGIELLLTRERAAFYSPSFFTRHGVSFDGKRAICVKGLYRFYDLFERICADRLLVATPGVCDPNWTKLPYTRIPRPIWPLDEEF